MIGIPMVYASPSLSLASVETFVHVDASLAPDDLVYVTATVPDAVSMEQVEIADLPTDWRSINHPQLQKIGSDWITAGSSLLLKVPSAAVEGEWNILLNPAHSEFSLVTIESPVKWKFDDRIFRKL